ncbi:MAG: hypothetical protein ACAH12_09955 [Methylophilaceae bacterium]|uniref:hypothetical protein n=1 Tax=Methylovorus sp. MM2 TaxID=1848038 RepID=UPI0007E1532E|nr:hypothetical protein [Methylovorus sp. MM2]OAM52741.1 hypothetical protein A7981_04635 [Methylovorus sp. MM2]
MTENREQEALRAYLNLLEKKGADASNLKRREAFLQKLMPDLADKNPDGAIFRDVVEDVIEQIDNSDWAFTLSVAREYYPFWIKDIKAIAAMSSGEAFEVKPIQWQPQDCNLKAIWKLLDKEKFSLVETWALKAYGLALRQEGATQDMVDTRIKLVKLLLVRLRDAPDQSPKVYRVGVDSTVALFLLQDTRRLFLAVVREFYYFWIGDPEAGNYIRGETPTSHF